MKGNKDLSFDVLEDSDINTIEKIGTEKMNIDKNARNRMLKITMRKYEAEKPDSAAKEYPDDEAADSVTGVELYERKRIPHIIYTVLCTAAALTIAVGSIYLLKKENHIVVNDTPLTTETTTTEASTVTSIVSAASAISTSSVSASSAVSTVSADSTDTTAATSTAATTTTAPQTNGPEPVIYNNPRTDRKDIPQEELDAAAVRAIEELMRENKEFWEQSPSIELTIQYTFHDVNGDSVPELFIRHSFVLETCHMYVFDGKDYIPARFFGHDIDGNEKVQKVELETVDVFTESNTIGMFGHQGGSQSFILYMAPDNTITSLHEYTWNGYYTNGRLTAEYSDDSNTDKKWDKWREFCETYNSYEHIELNWTEYTVTDRAE
ncbi:MAG: hypothetical protein IKW96_01320 [Ruminococcus sp.]|uniref:hypothetical protein n=1 Tax=Ruminococcus sp. TaxID=41978 RepID=UPI0025E424DB|nr:hypothetical protein [Ruminococcus sp.]MBR5681906.1 hypothetical protein [Ruminococcus sp.]